MSWEKLFAIFADFASAYVACETEMVILSCNHFRVNEYFSCSDNLRNLKK